MLQLSFLKIPTIFNSKSLALIGKGSFSKVLRASHRATGQKYAIKMIEKLSHESKESCDKELRVLRRTRHQNIIQLIEIYEGKFIQAIYLDRMTYLPLSIYHFNSEDMGFM